MNVDGDSVKMDSKEMNHGYLEESRMKATEIKFVRVIQSHAVYDHR
jgi:hypothetical protein